MIAAGVVRSPSSRFRRPLCRLLGWLTLAAAAPALFACTARSLEPPLLKPEPTQTGSIVLTANRNVDLLFMIDDSTSMAKSQENLRRNFPAFMTALKALPGGLPNVHIAVVSSDMGAGDGSVAACDATGGKNGVFQYTARGTCSATNLDPNATFISDIAGVRNYSGNLEDVFSCIASLGENGCGFEHQFAAITRALGADGQAPPVENQGFLRPEAYLAVVMITNEDDCSASPGVALFDTTSNTNLASPLGPPTNFRCNEFGHVCDGARPDRHAPNNTAGDTKSYASCVPAEDGFLLSVAETAARIKALKADPENQVMVAAITGPEAPYTVEWKASPASDTGPWPAIKHSCTASDGSYADPSTRTSAFVREFGGNGLQLSICDGEFAPALLRIAQKIGERVSKPCIAGRVAKKPGTNRDDCTVVSNAQNDAGKIIQTPVAACADTGGAGPCWQLAAGDGTCTAQTIDVVRDPAAPAAVWETASVQCSLCVDGMPDPARGCP
jgi:hypothetical protein